MPPARFEILDIPGSGAHAAVCVAKDRAHPERGTVVLKVLKGEFTPQSSEAKRVRDEARLLDLLEHPNIVRLDERLILAGRQVLVMEWVDGPALSRVVRKVGKLPPKVALEIARQIGSAIHYAYTLPLDDGPLRLVHRDLTLDNVLMSVHGEVKILDYGLAKADFADREAQTAISLRATPAYAAPEGLSTISDNPKLDVYALGICLFFMLTGHLPVLSRSALAHRSGLTEQLDWLRRECEILDVDGVVSLVLEMCSYNPSSRPPMDEVVAKLGARLNEPVDLKAFAERVVHPLHKARRRREPVMHEAFDELMFLQDDGDSDPTEGSVADQKLRAFLAKPGWEERTKELKWLLIKNPEWTARPFLELIGPALQPWWKVLVKRPKPKQTLVALGALRHRRDQEGVMDALRTLAVSRNVKVSAVANRLLQGDDFSVF